MLHMLSLSLPGLSPSRHGEAQLRSPTRPSTGSIAHHGRQGLVTTDSRILVLGSLLFLKTPLCWFWQVVRGAVAGWSCRGGGGQGSIFEGLSVVPGHLSSQLHGRMQVLVLGQDLLSVPPGVETLAQKLPKLSHGKEHLNGGGRWERSPSGGLWEVRLGRDKCLQVAAQARPMQSMNSTLLFFHRLDKFDRNLPYAFRQCVFLFSL